MVLPAGEIYNRVISNWDNGMKIYLQSSIQLLIKKIILLMCCVYVCLCVYIQTYFPFLIRKIKISVMSLSYRLYLFYIL